MTTEEREYEEFLSNQTCPECHKSCHSNDKIWSYDRYGNPWKKVCDDCYDRVQSEIDEWRFDHADAGEYLDEEF